MAMHRPSSNAGKPPHNQKRSKEVLEQFVAELADCGNITEAARRTGTGITPWLAYYWKRRSEDGYPGYTIDMGGEDDDGTTAVHPLDRLPQRLDVAALGGAAAERIDEDE